MNHKFLAAILVGTMLLTAVSACSESHTAISISDTLSVAQRFLSEMKYEQAIIEFDKILEVEPKNVEAYLGKAEAYIALGDIENAIKVLQEGYDQTGDERLKDRIEELTAHVETTVATTTTVSETTTTTETPTVSVNDTEISSEPIEGNHYLNEAERMLLSYIRGEGEFIPDLVKNVTYLEIWGKDFVSVDERVFF